MPTSASTRQSLPGFMPDEEQHRRKISDWMREIHQGRMPGNLDVPGTVSISGATALLGPVTLFSTLTVSGASVFGAQGTFNAGLTVLGTLSASAGNITNLTVSGATVLVNTLQVGGAATFLSTISASGGVVCNNVTINAGAFINGPLSVSSGATFGGTVSISGGCAVIGDVTGTGNGIFGNVRSRTASQSAGNGVPANIFTFPAAIEVAIWVLTVNIKSQTDAANYGAGAIVVTDNTTARFVLSSSSALITLRLSANTLEATQNSGATQTLSMSALKIL